MQIIPLHPNDRIQLKKSHPCGGSIFVILRVGRDMTLDRLKLEKSIRKTLTSVSSEQ